MIEVEGLTKVYGDKRGISDVSFSVREGEIVGLLGANGAGKTTTMNIITGYLFQTSGTVKVAGVDMAKNPVAAKRHIGYLPEKPPLYLDMTVEEYLEFCCRLKAVKSTKKYLLEICEKVLVDKERGRVLKNLSRGVRQRVGLAQALVGDPGVLIFDEPTTGLDPRQIVEIRKVIKELGKSRTVILSTHILPEAAAICERVLVISGGAIVADGKPDSLAGANGAAERQIIRVAGPRDRVLSLMKSREGVKSVGLLGEREPGSTDYLVEADRNVDVRKPLFSALAHAGYPILMLRPEAESLEEIFMKLTDEPEPGRAVKTGRKAD